MQTWHHSARVAQFLAWSCRFGRIAFRSLKVLSLHRRGLAGCVGIPSVPSKFTWLVCLGEVGDHGVGSAGVGLEASLFESKEVTPRRSFKLIISTATAKAIAK